MSEENTMLQETGFFIFLAITITSIFASLILWNALYLLGILIGLSFLMACMFASVGD